MLAAGTTVALIPVVPGSADRHVKNATLLKSKTNIRKYTMLDIVDGVSTELGPSSVVLALWCKAVGTWTVCCKNRVLALWLSYGYSAITSAVRTIQVLLRLYTPFYKLCQKL